MDKDVAAGSVLTATIFAILVAYFVFFEKASAILSKGLVTYKQVPMNIIIIALLVTLTLVVIIKAFFKRGTPLQGGMPSGHAAVAFAITTAVALWTYSAQITILVLIVALLLVQTRLEAGIHTLWELLAGSLLGSVITLLLFQVFF